MIQTATQLDFVSIQSFDLEKSKDFYIRLCGFSLAESPNDHSVVFKDTKGAIFACRTPLPDLKKTATLGAGVSLWFSVKDPDALFQHMLDQGAKVIRPITDGPFGRMFVVADPDGYTITIHGNS